MNKVLLIFGTRPEAIKMAPLIKEFERYPDRFNVKVCVTAQHREMLDQVLKFFGIEPDYDLNLMKPNQSLFELTANLIKELESVLKDFNPDLIFVQGDTTTAFVGALAGFYNKVKVAHIEAGLRSNNKYSPFPEEVNRVLIGKLADFHFAPTEKAKRNLLKEGIKNNVWVVGNTVIDALLLGLQIIKEQGEEKYYRYFDFMDFSKKIILVTGHRRESFGEPFRNICFALKELADSFEDVEIVYPVHLNPNVRKPVNEILRGHSRIHLIEPLEYPYLIWLMSKSYLVLTDSGGIQEEAPSLGKPVLVMREVTERIEGIEAGTAKLVGTNKEKIILEAVKLLENQEEYNKMAKAVNPYGDGTASRKILKILMESRNL
ncbi:non-hydrolyzing UDP-N-acetylglucosamine 2-epimerase [Phorcysia thermohydrogeniphila]|uniref:UDP-N-acetylglucosamine 2-epimerase (non-hydrolyzing) n=1 Tax=Phorcysia thermohydrogeniphila TaxID=936138 RepID=A0A4R1G9V9_9BACT|nr:UDP-N-acetylglucosamine 2-epimerase (non-hydrolyzing) [Phorcysia thermohydrogeniphila]TCK04448.1 UDP-N-acetylglucosamine 2-epimerase [Phorcysia thermohydrogeniphila]